MAFGLPFEIINPHYMYIPKEELRNSATLDLNAEKIKGWNLIFFFKLYERNVLTR